MLYLMPLIERSLLADPELAIVITEGQFKTLALWRLASHQVSDGLRFLPRGFRAYITGGARSARRRVRTDLALTSKARSLTSTGSCGKEDV
jgi:hypothetical protein